MAAAAVAAELATAALEAGGGGGGGSSSTGANDGAGRQAIWHKRGFMVLIVLEVFVVFCGFYSFL